MRRPVVPLSSLITTFAIALPKLSLLARPRLVERVTRLPFYRLADLYSRSAISISSSFASASAAAFAATSARPRRIS